MSLVRETLKKSQIIITTAKRIWCWLHTISAKAYALSPCSQICTLTWQLADVAALSALLQPRRFEVTDRDLCLILEDPLQRYVLLTRLSSDHTFSCISHTLILARLRAWQPW